MTRKRPVCPRVSQHLLDYNRLPLSLHGGRRDHVGIDDLAFAITTAPAGVAFASRPVIRGLEPAGFSFARAGLEDPRVILTVHFVVSEEPSVYVACNADVPARIPDGEALHERIDFKQDRIARTYCLCTHIGLFSP